MGPGLTGRQAEVAFRMIKSKSNGDIGTILDIDAQAVRRHSMAIVQRLGVGGRLALQQAVIQAALAVG
jgi:DNA-binding CsgD family transcriptional regulator